MVLSNLRDFLTLLRREGELAEVSAPVDPNLEIAEIHRRVIAAGGPALLFTNVKGSPHAVTTNLFGTARRIELAFGRRPLEFVKQAVRAVHELLPPTPAALWSFRGFGMAGLKVGLTKRGSGPVLEAMESPARLDQLPAITSWPEDGGPFVTYPLVYTEHPGPDGHGHNLGMYRMHVYDAQTTGMHWQIQKGGGFHYAAAEQQGRALPVTVFLGGPPALILAAVAPLPENVPELLLASLLMGGRIPRVADPRGGYPLLAEAEFALAGEVAPRVRRAEGPFGDHYGYYSLAHDFPVFQVQRVYHRRDAIYPATVVGKPRQEDFFIGDYLQELLSPLFPLVMPSVRDIWSYGETGFHSLAAAVVHERYAREALASAFRILGEGQLSLTKFLLITDAQRDLRDFKGTFEHVLARARFETDLFVFDQTAMDTLDYTGTALNRGSKGVLMGLGEPVRELPGAFQLPAGAALPQGVSAARPFCAGCLVVRGRPYAEEPRQAERIAGHAAWDGWPMVVLADDAEIAESSERFLWAAFTRFEPGGDMWPAGRELVRHHVTYRAPIVIDARMKPQYPKDVRPARATVELADGRWGEYFPQGMAQDPRPSGDPE
ncbi:MAG: UbiD family decarboxylase associated with menaquinone via futalosine [uncultured Chloroflexi bacterium]|uniref:UbiD family decarboxylase associated with menaquinone via futalosine n=1 Tax=uncultured Chloroflexota bacterium TaxID=166587 RepID=A0A6J4IQB1_9CHLR|nr:MAG: UbiD family decarboxylase associated with menaquinone via futalosine [uncultured Chloroflexota bacterium]